MIRAARFLAAVVAAAAMTGVHAQAPDLDAAPRDAAPRDPAPPVRAVDDDAREFVRFRIELDAPRALADRLRTNLELFRWREYETMTPDLLARLVQEAAAEAEKIVAAAGYFAAKVSATITEGEPAVPRAAADAAANGSTPAPVPTRVVTLAVDPGEPARIATVAIDFSGPIADGDAADRELAARVREAWQLPVGEVFTQEDWDRAKQRAVDAVAAQRYAGARIALSEARIDPERARADLAVTIDSGEPLRFGALRIRGLRRRPESLVHNLWTWDDGAAYDREQLDRFQRRLIATGYFASVQVDADPARAKDGAVPVRVRVIEGPSRRLELGLGYSTDTEFRATFDWRNNDFTDRDWRLRLTARLETLIQSGEASIDLPERPGWADSFGVRARRTDIENLVTTELATGVRTVGVEERSQPDIGATFVLSDQTAPEVLDERVYATVFSYGHTWRTLDNLLSPNRGFTTQAVVGAAPPGISTRAFGRIVGRAAWFIPVGPQDDFALRAEAGVVLAPTTAGIPQSFLFRTGGSTTVRGYDFDSLGVRSGTAVLGGRYLAVASAEYVRWIWEGIGAAVFVDAGNAWDRFSDLNFALGYGVGVRARSPIGPFRVDVAYGQQEHQVRLHFSVGLSF